MSCSRPWLAAASLLAAIPCAAWPAAAADRFEPVRRLVQDALEKDEVPSLAVAVARGGRIVWEEAFGWADRENGIAASPDTPYAVASISKPMTAAALMVLVERARIDLDRPVNEYLGHSPLVARVGDVSQATVRRVASHTAGLPLHHRFVSGAQAPAPMAETIRQYGLLFTPPGERYLYSNLGYAVLEHAVAQVSGRPFADFMRDEVFSPLGMGRSSMGPAGRMAAGQAVLYGPGRQRLARYDFDHRGASAAVASVHDLALFGLAQIGRPLPQQRAILSRRSRHEMERALARRPDGSGYGIGWEIPLDGVRGHRVVRHSGGMPGVSAELMLVPSGGMVVAVVSNTRCDLPHRVVQRILELLLPVRSRSPVARMTVWRRPSFAPRKAARFNAPRELRGTWRGTVETPQGVLGLELRFERSGAVVARVGEAQERRVLVPRMEGRFFSGRLVLSDLRQMLLFSLRRRKDVLNGSMTVLSPLDAPMTSALSHWAQLRRDGGS